MLTVAWVSPFPPDHHGGGGQIRQAYLLDALAAHASIHLICPGPVTDPRVQAAVASVVAVPVAPGWRADHRWWRRAADLVAAVGSPSPIEVRAFGPVRRAIGPALAGLSADLVLVEFAGLAPLLPRRRRVPWVLTFHNLPSRMAAQQAAIMPHRRQRWLLRRDARTARAFEHRAASAFDAVVTCTAADAAALRGDEVGAARRVMVVPNGTDIDRLHPSPLPAAARLVFTGALYTAPNTDAATWMAQKILPLIRAAEPAAQLAIVGAQPTAEVLALGRVPGVTVHADVADMAGFFREARVAVVPIRVGSGSRLKALEAMAAGRPVVGTSIGLEGLDLTAGQEVLVADDPEAFAAAVLRLLRDDSLAASLAHAGRTAVEARFAWPAIAAAYAASLVDLAAPSARVRGDRAPP
jgi:glycosyltransferase involved in cell wall biosynthesis